MRKMIIAVAALACARPAFAAAPVTGRWLTAEKDSILEVAPCGAMICGKIAKILAATKDGKPPVDANNPNPALRGRPIQGLTILSGFTDAGKNWKGTIYNPRNGKSYKSFLTKLADGTLKVQGCIAFACQGFIYTAVK
jgi:uncharacterized protein (DUF2147 family)